MPSIYEIKDFFHVFPLGFLPAFHNFDLTQVSPDAIFRPYSTFYYKKDGLSIGKIKKVPTNNQLFAF